MSDQPKRGRPSLYTPEVADEICLRLAAGETLNQICKDEHMPARPTVLLWTSKDAAFADKYAQARMQLLEHWADEVLDISDDGTNDWTDRETARGRKERVIDNEAVNRSRLRVDTRKWLLSKLRPERYGDKVEVDHSGEVVIKRVIGVEDAAV